jgi:hypothetical protein
MGTRAEAKYEMYDLLGLMPVFCNVRIPGSQESPPSGVYMIA